MTHYKAPFPWFGGKSTIAADVWQRLGADVANYVEPFAGSAAMLLSRPNWSADKAPTETINDFDGMVSNFWRALQAEPETVAQLVDWPVNENDLTARHIWLVNQKEPLTQRLEGDPEYYDAKIAGWWVWGICCWIGSGWCSGNGPWQSVDGLLTNTGKPGVKRQRPQLGNSGIGVNRQLVHLGDRGKGVNRQLVAAANGHNAGTGEAGLLAWMQALAHRLQRVRVASGDWQRVCGSTPTTKLGTTAVFLDPPYSTEAGRDMNVYAEDSGTVAHDVREWAIANGDNPKMRIALCGYDTEHGHHMPDGWEVFSWKAVGGYGNQGEDSRGKDNALREVVWFSPHCLTPSTQPQLSLFEDGAE